MGLKKKIIVMSSFILKLPHSPKKYVGFVGSNSSAHLERKLVVWLHLSWGRSHSSTPSKISISVAACTWNQSHKVFTSVIYPDLFYLQAYKGYGNVPSKPSEKY